MNPFESLARAIRMHDNGKMNERRAGLVARPPRGRKASLEPTKTTPRASSQAQARGERRTTDKTAMQSSNTTETNNLTEASRNNSRQRAGRAHGTRKPCCRSSARRTSRRIHLMPSSFRAYQINQNNHQASVSREMALIKSRRSKTGGGAHPRALNSSRKAWPEAGAKARS